MKYAPIEKIKLGEFRVRISFDDERMRSLVESIKRRGILYPLPVQPLKDGNYRLIAGERRLRAAQEAGLKEIPVIVREKAGIDNGLMEMGIENILREDLSFYERGRWVAKMKELGWTITSLAEETGIYHQRLYEWFSFYEDSERIKKTPIGERFQPETLPLRGMTKIRVAPISEEKKTELAVEASTMREPPSVTEIQRATRLIEQKPELKAREALELSRSITILLPIPTDLMPKLKSQADEWEKSLQDTVIAILRECLK